MPRKLRITDEWKAKTMPVETILAELDNAEEKAWQSLARYKFQMFGYWAAIWVHMNRLGRFGRANPFRELVVAAREELPECCLEDAERDCARDAERDAEAIL